MPNLPDFLTADAAITLAVALGCGLLIGIERERRKGEGPQRAPAGVRSFTLAALAGATAMLLGSWLLVAVGAAFVATLAVVSHARDKSDDPGVTTEIALFLIYLIGVLSALQPALAAGMAVVVAALLAAREWMHRFANEWLQPGEIRDGIVLAALALIALPLMPNRPLWGEVLNLRVLGQLFVLLLFIQALAHLAQRLLQARHAAALSALVSGFASSTALIAMLGAQVREGRIKPGAAAGAGLLSCVATTLQLLVVAAAVRPMWLASLWPPVLVGSVVVGVFGWLQLRAAPLPTAPTAQRLFSLRSAAMVATMLTGIQAVVYAVTLWLGDTGFMLATLLASLMDLHAAAAAVMSHGAADAALPALHRSALMVAVAVHGLNKAVVAAISGGRAFALALLPGLVAQAGLFAGVLWWIR
ncbi:MAG: MgtC/SapB family protein [Burkholderiales bacterium]|nr:MgtC/SapB family protein [Burkholderiales bacterium]